MEVLITICAEKWKYAEYAEAKKYADEAIQKSNGPDAMFFEVGILLSSNSPQAALDMANQLLAVISSGS